jgi:tetratricopeptide (TPR) repeat protein
MNRILNKKNFSITYIIFTLLFGSLYPQSGKYLEQAVSAMEAGLFKEALIQLDIARSKEPNNAEVYKLKALLHEAIYENNKAIRAWENCIKNTQDDDLINEARIHLNNLQEY